MQTRPEDSFILPAPAFGAFQAVLLQCSILCTAIHPYTRLPLILCQDLLS